jgi:hypothetical protein
LVGHSQKVAEKLEAPPCRQAASGGRVAVSSAASF